MVGRPDLATPDEARPGRDQPGSAAFHRQIETVRTARSCAILMVSRELHVVMAASDRVICLNARVCCAGAPEVVASAPAYGASNGSGAMGTLALYRHDHDARPGPDAAV